MSKQDQNPNAQPAEPLASSGAIKFLVKPSSRDSAIAAAETLAPAGEAGQPGIPARFVSRRYVCEICGAKCRTSKRNAGKKKRCAICENNDWGYDA